MKFSIMNTKWLAAAFVAILTFTMASCIEDGFSTSPSDQISFSVDTLDMGEVYTGELAATHRFVVYNRNNKGLNISRISLSGENAGLFRLNVDGFAGTTFSDVEIRAKDSIFVYVDVNLPENGTVDSKRVLANIDFSVNGIGSSLPLAVTGRDIIRMKGHIVTSDETFEAGRPYRLIDSLVVAPGATLTLAPGARLLFHDGARMDVRGSLRSEGTPDKPVVLTGDRTGEVIPGVSFDIMSRQWFGIIFHESSADNAMEFTEVSNTSYGVSAYGEASSATSFDNPQLTLVNCRLRNSGDVVLRAVNTSINAFGCEFAEASSDLVLLAGGSYRFDQCTASNNYLFTAISGSAWHLIPADTSADEPVMPTEAIVTNTITHGYGGDVAPTDLTKDFPDVRFQNCMFKANGTDDDNFVSCIWDADPFFYTVRDDYYFDYRVRPDSPAIGAAAPSISTSLSPIDFYGIARTSDLGAYTFTAPEE